MIIARAHLAVSSGGGRLEKRQPQRTAARSKVVHGEQQARQEGEVDAEDAQADLAAIHDPKRLQEDHPHHRKRHQAHKGKERSEGGGVLGERVLGQGGLESARLSALSVLTP